MKLAERRGRAAHKAVTLRSRGASDGQTALRVGPAREHVRLVRCCNRADSIHRSRSVRAIPVVVSYLLLLASTASIASAQSPSSAERGAESIVRPTVIGRWVLDSTPPRKNQRQTYVAAIAASDTVVGRNRTTRPILRLYCHNNVREVGLEIHVGQQIDGTLPGVTRGSSVGYTQLLIQRDSQPEQKAAWLYHLNKQVMGPDKRGQSDAIKELSAASQYRVGVPIYKIGRRYMTFDVADVAERLAWVADHCGVKPK